jgi:hypothetical protein
VLLRNSNVNGRLRDQRIWQPSEANHGGRQQQPFSRRHVSYRLRRRVHSRHALAEPEHAGHKRGGNIQADRRIGGARHTERRNQCEAGDERASNGTQCVDAIQRPDTTTEVRIGLNRCSGKERKRGAHQGGGDKERQNRRQETAGRQERKSAGPKGVRQAVDHGETPQDLRQQQPAQGDAELEHDIEQNGTGDPVTATTGHTRTQRKPSHVRNHDGAQGVRPGSEHIAQGAGPGDFIDEPGGAGNEKDRVENREPKRRKRSMWRVHVKSPSVFETDEATVSEDPCQLCHCKESPIFPVPAVFTMFRTAL